MEAIETIEKNGFTLSLYPDKNPESPRDWDNAGTMVYWHTRYNLGDVDGRKEYGDPSEFEAWWKTSGKGGVILSLYLYDHSGLTMRTHPFSCPWDSGQVGYIYATKETVVKEWGKSGKLTRSSKAKALKHLEAEVETYDQYLCGDVYGYIIEDAQGKHVDSCWGFCGFNYANQEAQAQLDYWISEYARREIEAQRDNVY